MTENTDIRKLSRNLKEKTNTLKKWAEKLDDEVDSILELMNKKEAKIQKMENASRVSFKTNDDFHTKIISPSKSSLMARRKSRVNLLQPKMSEQDIETVIACQFSEIEQDEGLIRTPSQISVCLDTEREVSKQMSQIITSPQPKEMPKTAETLLEDDEKEAMELLLLKSKQARLFKYFWDFLKILLTVVLCFGLCIGLIFLYAHFFNSNLIANILFLLYSDHEIAELTQFLSPQLTWKNDGLLPF